MNDLNRILDQINQRSQLAPKPVKPTFAAGTPPELIRQANAHYVARLTESDPMGWTPQEQQDINDEIVRVMIETRSQR